MQLRPQEGPQEIFLSSEADIAIYGGGAGGGKSFAILLEPVRHLENKEFKGVIFRREMPMITNPGGLWDESMKMYRALGADPNTTRREWLFPSGMSMKFSHLQLEDDKHNWQGAQVPFLGFDELTHFSESQFFYMLSRVRSTSGVPGYVRATTNPDPDSWVAKFIEWWIEQDITKEGYGLPIPERSGVLRWFIRINDATIWASTVGELVASYGADFIKENPPTSVTFIPAKVTDNKILMEKDPAYLAKLNAMGRVDRARLKDGNWKVKAAAGNIFRRSWFKVVDAPPVNVVSRIRYWDRAATEIHEGNKDPDWTRGVRMSRDAMGNIFVEHVESLRGRPAAVETAIKNTAQLDGRLVQVGIEQDPGSAGKMEADYYVRILAGWMVGVYAATKDKVTRAKPFSSQAERGNVFIVKGAWNDEYLKELEEFPEGGHDDQVDASSGAFNALFQEGTGTFTDSMSQFSESIEDRWSR
jgi:predicted phage terminase large subunit-like protein